MILASQSPRRKEILSMLGLSFSTYATNINEEEIMNNIIQQPSENVFGAIVSSLAENKAKAIDTDELILAADTIVVCENEIMGKPQNASDARRMLHQLCGKTHAVYTGFSIRKDECIQTYVDVSEVTFYPLSALQEEWIEQYIASGSPFDKAGAYGIQDFGSLLIEKIEGDFFSIMGLPIRLVARALDAFPKRMSIK